MPETIDSANAAASTLFLGHNGEWWDFSLIIAGILVAIAATAAVVATAGSIVAHKREAAASDEALERYKLGTAKGIADANARAAEAKLALEKFKEPRTLDPSSNTPLVAGLKKYEGTRVDIIIQLSGPDSYGFGNNLATAFGFAKWKIKVWNSIPQFNLDGVTVSGKQAGDFSGTDIAKDVIEILEKSGIAAGPGMPFTGDPRITKEEMTLLGRFIDGTSWDPNDVAPVRVVVGPKPP